MPVYEYQCKKCGKITEVFHLGLTENPPKSCPECGGRSLSKLMSLPGMVRCENPAAGESAWRVEGRKAEKSSEKSGEKAGEKSSEKTGKKSGATSSGKEKPPAASPRSSGGVSKKADTQKQT